METFFDSLREISSREYGWMVYPTGLIRNWQPLCPLQAVVVHKGYNPLHYSFNNQGKILGLTIDEVSTIISAADKYPNGNYDKSLRQQIIFVLNLTDR